MLDRIGLGVFLRLHRESVSPLTLPTIPGTRRRTPGLRRGEVAELAGMSTNYYERLEQARGPRPSEAVLAAIARALQLTRDEQAHLYGLAGHQPPRAPGVRGDADGGLVTALEALAPTTIGLICGPTGDVLAENALSVAVFSQFTGGPGNLIRRWFTDRAWRDALVPPDQQEATGRAYVADLRASVEARTGDRLVTAFVRELRSASAEFARMWDRYDVSVLRAGSKTLLHRSGRLELDCAVLPAQDAHQRLVLFRAVPGTPAVGLLQAITAA